MRFIYYRQHATWDLRLTTDIYPLDGEEIADFCRGQRAVLVLEEGQPEFIEQQLSTFLYRSGSAVRLHGKGIFPMAGEYTGQVMLDAVTAFLYRETSTIGLRIQRIGRRKLPRRELTADTSFGPVRAKAVIRDGEEKITAEFEECRRIARERGIPLPEVIRRLDQELRQTS